jgi:hypothetical protein
MDLSIVDIVLLAVVVWIVSQILLGVMDAFAIVKLQERVDVLKRLRDIIHQVKIEKNGDIEYWYDADNNHFLGQGKTLDEVVAVLKSRFPDHIFLLEDLGGIAEQTGWKLISPDEFKKIELISK